MIEILRDSIWTFVSTLAAIAAVVAAIAIYFRQRERKRLLAESVARVPLLAVGRQGIAGLQLTFKGEALTNATIHIFRVVCIGNRPILANDFETPVTFVFSDATHVLAADVIQTSPEGIPVTASVEGNTALLTRHLLNPGDSVVCRLLVTNSGKSCVVQGRIVGVKRIERSRSTPILPAIAMLVSGVLIIGGFLLSPNPKSTGISDIRTEELPYLGAMLAGMLIMMVGSTTTVIANLRKRFEKRRLIGQDEV